MKNFKQTASALVLLFATSNLAGCIPFVDLYLVAEGGYQFSVEKPLAAVGEREIGTPTAPNPDYQVATNTDAKGFVYGGGLGLSFSALRLHAAAEINLGQTKVSQNVARFGENGDRVMVNSEPFSTSFKEALILNLMGEAGIYVFEDLLLFARGGYVYTLADKKFSRDLFKRRENTFAIGGGLEYQIGLGLGIRAYYLQHISKERKAKEVRGGVVWRF